MDHIIAQALRLAAKAAQKGEIPVGAVIFNSTDKNILCSGANRVEALQDSSAHAELVALKKATRLLHSKYLNGWSIYITLEPCPMCATALSFARIDKIYFGAYDSKGGGIENGAQVYRTQKNLFKPAVEGGLAMQESLTLLKDFFTALRRRNAQIKRKGNDSK